MAVQNNGRGIAKMLIVGAISFLSAATRVFGYHLQSVLVVRIDKYGTSFDRMSTRQTRVTNIHPALAGTTDRKIDSRSTFTTSIHFIQFDRDFSQSSIFCCESDT